MNKLVGSRVFYLLCSVGVFLVETAIALWMKDAIIRPYVGDMLVVVLVYCVARIFIARPLKWLPLWVFLFACCVEALQFFNVADRLGLAPNTVARVVLGAVFDWKDIACYAVGTLPLFWVRR